MLNPVLGLLKMTVPVNWSFVAVPKSSFGSLEDD